MVAAMVVMMAKKKPVEGPGPRIGQRVRWARGQLKWSQEQLAIQAGLEDRSWIASLETGQIGEPSADKVYAVARAMGVPVEYLITGSWPQDVVRLPARQADLATRLARRYGERGLRLADRLLLEVFTDLNELIEGEAEGEADSDRPSQAPPQLPQHDPRFDDDTRPGR